MRSSTFTLDLTTQGPLYPPSEVMDEDGNFILIGAVNREGPDGVETGWGGAIVAADSPVPPFGERAPYRILETFDPATPPPHVARKVLHTLPIPLPCNNYHMLFAPEQAPGAREDVRPSYGFHETPIPDLARPEDRQLRRPVTLGDWIGARGSLTVDIPDHCRSGRFRFAMEGLLPRSLYTIMSLRSGDLDPGGPTRPEPLGVPNVFVTDAEGRGAYDVEIADPFPAPGSGGNRIVNVVVLFMSYQLSHGGAIGRYGLGGDIHAQLKFARPVFGDLVTRR
ncbi:hypothetical protein [Salinarimonas ramus]|uniref:Uncharacterized protein n=1 Tax=Salinarimonas ramus TaxID=690164 RepID=A0A917Q6Q6_9HYPH|nr:hypothetical protein [Salinarimonas ramus]GGK30752.1 hypothetical protein GCM10011322_16700 [Salinarimonas ramus]